MTTVCDGPLACSLAIPTSLNFILDLPPTTGQLHTEVRGCKHCTLLSRCACTLSTHLSSILSGLGLGPCVHVLFTRTPVNCLHINKPSYAQFTKPPILVQADIPRWQGGFYALQDVVQPLKSDVLHVTYWGQSSSSGSYPRKKIQSGIGSPLAWADLQLQHTPSLRMVLSGSRG